MTDQENEYNDDPLPLQELIPWISSEDHVEWIRQGDAKQAALEAEMQENEAYNAANLFGSQLDEEHYGVDTTAKRRVQQWTSSAIHMDGIGGFDPITVKNSSPAGDESQDTHVVQLEFILSESYQGFGDTLWSSARYVGNVLANPDQCRKILAPYLERRRRTLDKESKEEDDDDRRHPLLGTSVLEVGAGAGLPSWSAMHCGARVVCTDLADTNRIRSIAECACRNYRKMQKQQQQNAGNDNDGFSEERLKYAKLARACPHDWGSDVQPVLNALNHPNKDAPKEEEESPSSSSGRHELFDVILAADCCYMPWTHDEMLDSIYKVLSPIGICLVCFALHDNTDDADVWKIVDRAKNRGFEVETLPSTQLTPPTTHMEAKQGLVHTIRLSKPQ